MSRVSSDHPSADNPKSPNAKARPLRPSYRFGSQLLAIEQRMLFDGALAVTADAVSGDAKVSKDIVDSLIDRTHSSGASSLAAPGSAPRDLVVIDSTVANWQQIAGGANPNAQLLILDPAQDGLSQIAQAMAGGNFGSVHIVSHGTEGRLLLGNRAVTASNLATYSADLQTIGQNLTSDGDILLYGCDIGRGTAGASFLQALAQATHADIAASTNDTGGTAKGGDWVLESSTGAIEAKLAIDASTAAAYDGLLVAQPTVTLGAAKTATGDANKVLLGETFSMVATFDNTDPLQTGFGPYIDVFYSANGADGGDGLSFTGATYLGSPLTVTQITLTAGDISAGNVTHPYFTDSAGAHKVSIASGYVAGDKLMVVQLPFGSFTAGQPAAAVTLTGALSNLADLSGGPALNVTARGGFRYGTDALNNPASDPSLQQAGALPSQTITPELYRLRTTYIGPENETATGINYQRAYRIDVDVAEGQTLTNLQLQDILPNSMQYSPISGTSTNFTGFDAGLSPTGAWTNVNGVLVSSAATGASAPATPGGTVSRTLTSVTGTSGAIDASMVVQFYVPEFDAASALVLNPTTGDDKIVQTTVQATPGGWIKIAGANDASSAPVIVDAKVPLLTEQSISTQKGRTFITNVGPTSISPGDKVEYTINVQVSDYFAFGGATTPTGGAGGTQKLQIIDTLSDGLIFDTAFAPQLIVSRATGVTEATIALLPTDYVYTYNNVTGQEVVTVDIAAVLTRVGRSNIFVGDQFGADNTQTAAMTAKLVFRADVLDAYRVGPADENGVPVPGSTSSSLNEGDRLINLETISGTVLDVALNPNKAGLFGEIDDSKVVDVMSVNAIDIALTSINANAVPPATTPNVTPGDLVTYRVRYTVPTGDFENFKLSAYLPQPVYSITDPDANPATPAVSTYTSAGSAFGVTNPHPPAGQYSYRVIDSTGADVTATTPISAVTVDPVSNGITFDLGDRSAVNNLAVTIEIFFTAQTSAEPFVDGLFLTATSLSEGQNTAIQPITTQSIVQFNLTEPVLHIFKAAVQDDVSGATVFNRAFTATDPSSFFRIAGDATTNPLAGGVLTSANIRTAGDLTNTLANVDAGDTVRYAIVIENTGTSACGAYDIKVRDSLPAGIALSDIVPGSLKIVRGDGVVLVAGVDYTGDINTLFGANGIEFIDKPDPIHGGILGAARGLRADGTVINGVAGANVLVVTYDVKLPSIVAGTSVQAGTTYSSNAEVFNYTGSDGLNTTLYPALNFAATPLTDPGAIDTPLPVISKLITATSEGFTSGNNVVIGEVVTYSVTLTIPEGRSSNARFVDSLDPGLAFVDIVSITSSPGLVVPTTTTSFNAAASTLSVDFGTVENIASNSNATSETITIVYRAVATDIAVNQAAHVDNNTASLTVSNAAGTDRVVTATNSVTIVEPDLSITKVADKSSVQIGETVKYTVTITNGAGGIRANDINLLDSVPAGLTFTGFVGAPVGLTQSGGAITGTNLSGAMVGYLEPGESYTFMYTAVVTNTATLGQTFSTNATVDWSSVGGLTNNNLSPLTTTGDTERTGAGGVDDYVRSASVPVTVLGTTAALTIVQTSEPSTGPGSAALPVPASPGNAENVNVAPGEIVRYRMIVQLPEVNAPNARFDVALPNGIRFLNDNTTKIGFVADGGGISSSVIPGGTIAGGGINAGSISGLTPTLLLASSQITGGASSGADVSFALGNLINTDADGNAEFIVIEFNAMVDNADAAVVSGAALPASFNFVSNSITQSSDTDVVTVVEPQITNVAKTVTNVTGSVATFTTTFTNSGNAVADSVHIVDSFAAYPNITFGALTSVQVNGSTVAVPNGPSGLDVTLPTGLLPGQSVTITYTGTITDLKLAVPTQDVVVTYTSLSAAGTTLTAGGGTSTTSGERTGSTSDYGSALNTYRDVDGAGLGVVSGRLWDDTPVYGTGAPSDSYNVGEHTLGGRIVNLRDVSSTLIIASATTLADGTYYFGGVPVGNYTVEVATPSFDDAAPGGSGRIKIRYDAAGGTPVQQSDGVISVSVAEGATIANRDFGYVQLNDAPTIAKPADKIINEDQVLSFDGGVGANSAGVITVADEVQNVSGSNVAALSVNNGVLNLATGFVVPAGVTVAGQGTGAMTLTGSIVNINAVLAKLQYTPNLNYNGSDALTIRIDDKGAQGDADGDCIPNEVIDDNLFTTSVVNITMLAVNDPPIARPDEQTVVGLAPPATGNAITGVGNQIPSPTYGADTDVDGPTLTVVNVSNVKSGSTPVTAGTPGTLIGDYGTLVLQSNGSYTYTQNVAVVSTLNLATGPVSDTFTYSVSDGLAPPVTTTIKINIGPVNAVPVANPDVNSTVEGATAPVGGNVITKPPGVNGDVSDTDATIGGPALVLQGASVGNVAAGPNLTGGLGGTGLTGAHGTLIINSNGSYSYQVNNADPAVIALNPASPAIQDVFTYTVTDTQGGRANTTLTINITGINNPPVANNDTRSIPADQTIANGQAIAGNGLGDVKDTDPDAADAGLLTICGVTPGSTAIVPSTGVGSVITGTFGDLVLQSNGSYTYTPNAAARALPLGQAAVDTFTYCLQDPALAKTTGKITINLLGVNDLPVANPELFQLNKASPPKTGNAITGLLPGEQKDTDPDNDTLTVQGVNSGTPTGPITGRVNTPVVGSYGTLVLQADGSYTYTLDPTKTATIAKTDTVSDVFTYTITDPNGGKSTTTITFKVSGDNQAPSGTDKVLPVNEDTPYLITPADFGFSDPDVGDTFKAVRITTLPDVAAGKLFYNGQEVALTNGFFQVAFADINKLEFRPAPNVNTANLAQAPNISFQVCDNDGLLDPTPNRLTFNIVPVNDPPKATQSVYAMDAGSPTCALDPLPLVSGVRPGATDPDLPADTLTVTLNAVPPADQGQYFVGSSLVPLKAGDTLTPAQLQQLCFKPNTAITGTRLPDGSIATAPLLFTVSDGKGGQDTTGSVQVNVKPTPSLPPVAPPRITPLLPVAPILTVPFLPPPTRAAVTNASNLRAMDDIRLSPIEAASDLDAGGYFDSGRINAVWNRERVAGVQVVAEEKEAPKPKKVEVECEPAKPKEKPKLKVVKRSVFADNLKDGPNKNFTEQLKAAQKRFKPPAKVMPKPQLQRDC